MIPDNLHRPRRLLGAVFVVGLLFLPEQCRAQSVAENTVQVAGLANVIVTSGPVKGASGRAEISGFSSAALGIDASIYLSPNVSVGGLFGYQRLSLGGSAENGRTAAATGYYGPVAHLRLPLDERSAFVLTGSVGGVQVSLHNQRTDLGEALDLIGLGRYWLAGGGVSVGLSQETTVDLTARYQSSTFRVPGQATTRVSAGLQLGIGFSVYLF